MKEYVLYRLGDGPDGTLGVLTHETEASYATFEEEDQANRPNISRIPAGEYLCRRSRFNAGGYDSFEVMNVPGRSLIKFHIANTEEDLAGCIGVGTAHGIVPRVDEDTRKLRYKAAVLGSRTGFRRFMQNNEGVNEFSLRIIDPGQG